MNKRAILAVCGIGAAAFLIGLGLGRHLAPSAGEHGHAMAVKAPADESAAPAQWTCSMHPQIRQSRPGSCPICGMDLVRATADAGTVDGRRTLSMSASSRALADIQTTAVVRDFPEASVRMVGKLAYDETRVKSLSARFPARIDELYVNFVGIRVERGEHLAKVYSPELLIAQRELLTAYASDPESALTRAAREKLRLWDLLPDQVDAIVEDGEASDHFILRSPIGGVVVSKNVAEGDYIETGETLLRIVDLSKLWLYLDAYESDLAWLRYGQDVAFTVEAFPWETFRGKITFIEPVVNRRTRTVSVRVNVSNADGRLKPGMFARGTVTARMAAGGRVHVPEIAGKWISPMHPEIVKDGPGQCDVCGMDLVPAEELGYVQDPAETPPIVIPDSSVLRTGKRAVVYLQKFDAERLTYEGREIVLGPRAGDFFIVHQGLMVGERIVTNGAFKIDSALQIQAKPSMMNPEGGGSAPGHRHGGENAPSGRGEKGQSSVQELEISGQLVGQLIGPYLQLQAALSGDDLLAAKASVKLMLAVSGHSRALGDLLRTMSAAESLDGLRRPHFERLSNAIIAAVKANPDSFEGELFIMHCPMVYPDRGADWLQSFEFLQNPYFGARMLRCGSIEETIKATESGHKGNGH